MTVLVIAALVAFGGYLITIPRLLFDEWSIRRAQNAQQVETTSGEHEKNSEVRKWNPLPAL